MRKLNEVTVDNKRGAWIDEGNSNPGDVSFHLMVTNNGFQASGAAFYSIEVAKAAYKALGDYIAELERKKM